MEIAMVSQPMTGKSEEEIKKVREKAIKELTELGYEVVPSTYVNEEQHKKYLNSKTIVQHPIFYLSKALEQMSFCKAVYFCKGWKLSKGCMIEHYVASVYGLTMIYEDNKERIDFVNGKENY